MTKFFSGRGFRCYRFNYPTRTKSIKENALLLQQWLTHQQITHADFICHSMGGLVCRGFLEKQAKQEKYCNVVCLGSPFRGSVIAQNLSASKFGSKLLAVQADSELSSGIHSWPDNSNLGIIAGDRNIGVGRLLGLPASAPGDGTILVDETRIEGAADHIILPVTHSQMTFSKLVAEQANYFINHQRFDHNNDSN